jgi:hypothetical protein
MQDRHDVGPLPQGLYTMTALVANSPHIGLATIILQPDLLNRMFGRSGLRVHGANTLAIRPLQTAVSSQGTLRIAEEIWVSGDRTLKW